MSTGPRDANSMGFDVDCPLSVMADRSWDEVRKYAREAAVFLDDCAAESLHWHGGCALLYRAGAKSVRELSSFEVSAVRKARAFWTPFNVFRTAFAERKPERPQVLADRRQTRRRARCGDRPRCLEQQQLSVLPSCCWMRIRIVRR